LLSRAQQYVEATAEGQRFVQMMMFLNVPEERFNRKNEFRFAIRLGFPGFPSPVESAGERIIFVLIVRVKRPTAHVGSLANVLHRNSLVTLFLNQGDERLRQSSRALRASIGGRCQTDAAFCPFADISR
jgi:hypothetical protein